MSSTYTEPQTRAVLRGIGIEVKGETSNDFACLCPFHGNRYTPSLSVSKLRGTFICFNPSCNETGTLLDLVRRQSGRNHSEALRFIAKHEGEAPDPAEKLLEALEPEKQDLDEFPQHIIDRCVNNFWSNDVPQRYMRSRGFEKETAEYFKIGFSPENDFHPDVITVPMHDHKGMPVGFIGRLIEGKGFKNSTHLPTSKTWWNLHRAKRESQSVIVTEASFDAARTHQAGFPGVIANLSGHVNALKLAWLDRYFTRIIIATDFDKHIFNNIEGRQCKPCKNKGFEECQGHNPGRDLGHTIANALPHKDIWWAVDSYMTVYPNGAKDLGELTDGQIVHVIKNAIPNVEYISWDIY